MIDIENYKRSIQWLERGVAALALEPNNETVHDSVMLSFEVTYNVSESVLRGALSEDATSLNTAQLSSRELMRYASDEGLLLSSGESWLRYGIALECANNTHGDAFLEYVAPVLPQYLKELNAFFDRLEQRLVLVA